MNTSSSSLTQAQKAIQAARSIVIFTGAGMSAESGVPTFRDAMTGLWARFPAEALATYDAYIRDPELVWGWYEWRRSKILGTMPHAGHCAIAEFSQRHESAVLVTQNVDNLHERAGSADVLHLHGSLFAPRCIDCSQPGAFSDEHPQEPEGGRRIAPPRCKSCNGLLRPGVVWFGESLPQKEWQHAKVAAEKCDLMICIGTSGLVYPAAGLPATAVRNGATLIQINPDETPLNAIAHFNLHGSARNVLPKLLRNR